MEDNHSLPIQKSFTCGRWNLTQEEYDFQSLHGWWVQNLASVVVGVFGMIVNIITIVILSTEEMKKILFKNNLLTLAFDALMQDRCNSC